MKEKNKKIETQEAGDEDILVVQEATHLNDGIHDGTIKNVVHENRQGFNYIDFYIDVVYDEEKGDTMTIKTGFPAYISSNSSLGRFLDEAGLDLKPGDKVGLQKIKDTVIGREIAFQTFTEDQFAKVLNKTIKFN